jgi:hypothetical protein
VLLLLVCVSGAIVALRAKSDKQHGMEFARDPRILPVAIPDLRMEDVPFALTG